MQKQNSWKNLVVFLIASSFAYIFMEWLFLTTMPSYMSEMSLLSKLEIMFAAGGFLVCAGIAPIALLGLIDLVVLKSEKRGTLLYAALLVPAAIVSSLLLLLVDNFTYTVFKFGIVDSTGLWRGLYALGFLALWAYSFRRGIGFVSRPVQPRKHIDPFPAFVTAVVLLTGVSLLGQYQPVSMIDLASLENVKERPNILIIGSDGVNAANMSLYGYERDTTPNLTKLAQISLVAQNAFTNGGESSFSVVSILTGKLPSRVYAAGASQVLMGEDSYQHLPGILKELGYYSVEIGVPHYVDAYDSNLQGAFDEVNNRSNKAGFLFQVGTKYGFGSITFFLETASERISSRLLHIFFIQRMENPYKIVTEHSASIFGDDQAKIDQLVGLVSSTDEPVFMHLHLMGTHGGLFAPKDQIYSKGQEQSSMWMTDFYDDAIRDFDIYVQEVFDALSASGELEHTIVVIYTDHNMLHETNQRIPLMIHFPGGEHAGVIHNSVQNIDIAPTILDYLDIPQPEWMAGTSLLRGEPPVDRLIYSSNLSDFAVTMVDCNRWFRFDRRGFWYTGDVEQHTAPCASQSVFSLNDVPAEVLGYLNEYEFTPNDKPEAAYLSPLITPTLSQVAVLLLQTKYGSEYLPPAPVGLFADVPVSHPLAGWIEQSYRDGIVGSCAESPLSYCPDSLVTRGQIAEYLLKTKYGGEYVPSPATGIFTDVPVSSPNAAWVEELYRRKITGGCIAEPLSYCPDVDINGGQFTVFLSMVFSQP
ncbi:MAG: sulfatase-like hydrolase/transferase [Chloroflexi bacterium]|nr:sulfatase-like hydrolase/transferase [Chloroflexota bacterium]